MLFTDQHVIVLGADDSEIDMGIWSDELDDLARYHHGYVVVINSEPAEIVADYRGEPGESGAQRDARHQALAIRQADRAARAADEARLTRREVLDLLHTNPWDRR